MKYLLLHDGSEVEIEVRDLALDQYEITAFGRTFVLRAHREADGALTLREGHAHWRAPETPLAAITVLSTREAHRRELQKNEAHGGGGWEIRSPMPGKIVSVAVAVEAEVKAAQGLVTVEAMKMENELRAPQPGVITEVLVQPGQTVTAGAVLIRGRGLSSTP